MKHSDLNDYFVKFWPLGYECENRTSERYGHLVKLKGLKTSKLKKMTLESIAKSYNNVKDHFQVYMYENIRNALIQSHIYENACIDGCYSCNKARKVLHASIHRDRENKYKRTKQLIRLKAVEKK